MLDPNLPSQFFESGASGVAFLEFKLFRAPSVIVDLNIIDGTINRNDQKLDQWERTKQKYRWKNSIKKRVMEPTLRRGWKA